MGDLAQIPSDGRNRKENPAARPSLSSCALSVNAVLIVTAFIGLVWAQERCTIANALNSVERSSEDARCLR